VRSAGKTVFVDLEDVDWMEAAENYVQLHTGRANHLLHVAMNTLERSLDPEIFLRIHRSIIINIGRIKELQAGAHGDYVVTLQSGVRLQSGRTYSEKLKTMSANPF
jgi:two-component system LytT family response regulator